MPRMKTWDDELLPASGALLANCRFGTTWSSSVVSNTCRSVNASPENTDTAIGVSWRFSSKRRAVTMTSSSALDGADGACAPTSNGMTLATAPKLRTCARRACMFMSLCCPGRVDRQRRHQNDLAPERAEPLVEVRGHGVNGV